MVTMVNGKCSLIFKDYRFYRKNKSVSSNLWSCVRFPKCRAAIKIDEDLTVLLEINEHCHAPKQLILMSCVQLITTVSNRLLLLYKGHYYSKTPYIKKKWRCINTNMCFAFISVSADFSVEKESGEHHHRPKVFIKTSSGKYKIVKAPTTSTTDYELYEIVQEAPDN